MNYKINIESVVSNYYIKKHQIRKIVIRILSEQKIKQAIINIVIVHDNLIKKLNKRFLKTNSTTDVLSFELENYSEIGILEGEIYANIEQIKRQAKEYNVKITNELNRIIVHGMLHLIGYDDSCDREKEIMIEKENYYLSLI